jgi:hypothetical protein
VSTLARAHDDAPMWSRAVLTSVSSALALRHLARADLRVRPYESPAGNVSAVSALPTMYMYEPG